MLVLHMSSYIAMIMRRYESEAPTSRQQADGTSCASANDPLRSNSPVYQQPVRPDRKTSTPVDHNDLPATFVERLRGCLSATPANALPILLDNPTDLPSTASIIVFRHAEESLDNMMHVMSVFMDSTEASSTTTKTDLNVRRAAGEQICTLIKRTSSIPLTVRWCAGLAE